jgi:glutathione S-transferase
MFLHGGPLSPFVRKVTMALAEKGLLDSVRLLRTPTAMLVPNTKLMADNPLSKIPTLIAEDGMSLFDSDVICEYLDVTFGPATLIPAPGPHRWRVLKDVAMACGLLDVLVLARFAGNFPPAQQSPEWIAAMDLKLQSTLDQVEGTLPELAADEFNLAHISYVCLFGYLDLRFAPLDWRARHPLAAAWYRKFALRPSAQLTQPYEYKPAAAEDPSLQGRLYWE